MHGLQLLLVKSAETLWSRAWSSWHTWLRTRQWLLRTPASTIFWLCYFSTRCSRMKSPPPFISRFLSRPRTSPVNRKRVREIWWLRWPLRSVDYFHDKTRQTRPINRSEILELSPRHTHRTGPDDYPEHIGGKNYRNSATRNVLGQSKETVGSISLINSSFPTLPLKMNFKILFTRLLGAMLISLQFIKFHVGDVS